MLPFIAFCMNVDVLMFEFSRFINNDDTHKENMLNVSTSLEMKIRFEHEFCM